MRGVSRYYRFNLLVGLIIAFAAIFTAFSLSGKSVAADTPDCNANAVVYCGATSVSSLTSKYMHGDGRNSAASIQHIYNYFGISGSDIQAMGASTPSGTVDSHGNVFVNGQLVATSARTAGRQTMSNSCGGSKQVSSQGTTLFTRATCVSFASSPLQAFIVMKNNTFQFAILKSCGNPVTATPKSTPQPKTPSYTIEKEVAPVNSTNYSHDLSVMAGAHVTYRIQATNTGQVDITGVKVADKLPSDIVFVSNTLKLNNQSVNAGHFFDTGYDVGTLNAGATDTFTFEAIVGPNDTPSSCNTETLDNSGTLSSSSLSNQSSMATVNKQCQPKPKPPVVACSSLTSTPVSRSAFSFTAQASAQNSTIESYSFNFGDGTAAQSVATANSSATIQHQYANPGNYTASVSVSSSGVSAPVTSPACSTPISVAQPPAAECTNLQVTPSATDQHDISATVSYQASNGASLQSIAYDFGDTQTQTTSATTVQHTYAKDGNYTVKAVLTFTGPQAVPASTCQAPVSVMTVQPTCDLLQVSPPDANGNVSVTAFQTTDNGSTFTGADIDWGDGSTDSSVNPVVGKSHQFAMPAPGSFATYQIVAVSHFTVDGQDVTANSDGCKQQVTLTTSAPTPPPSTPTVTTASTPASALVNTGAGGVIGVFSLAAVGGVFAYRRYLRRHLLS